MTSLLYYDCLASYLKLPATGVYLNDALCKQVSGGSYFCFSYKLFRKQMFYSDENMEILLRY